MRLINSLDGKHNDGRRTPPDTFRKLDDEFHFNDDPCPLEGATNDCAGLLREWGTSTFVNPPYSNPSPWCEKAVMEWRKGKTVVMLLRVDTSTRWFHRFVLPFAKIRWIEGRLKFDGLKCAPFASMIAIYSQEKIL